MNILLVLIPVTLLVIVIAAALFFWAVNHQQFDDLDSPAILPLLDDPAVDATPSEAVALHPHNNIPHADPDQGRKSTSVAEC